MASADDRLTDEQRAVVTAIVHKRRHVSVNAVAGSGKTTTALCAARAFIAAHDRPVLLLVYNSRIKEETREKVRQWEPQFRRKMTVENYHSLALNQFFGVLDKPGIDDALIDMALSRKPVRPFPAFGLVIFDEAQDLVKSLHLPLVEHVLRLLPQNIRATAIARQINDEARALASDHLGGGQGGRPSSDAAAIPPSQSEVIGRRSTGEAQRSKRPRDEQTLRGMQAPRAMGGVRPADVAVARQDLDDRPQVLVIGDPFQQIFRYRGADSAALIDPDVHFRDLPVRGAADFVSQTITGASAALRGGNSFPVVQHQTLMHASGATQSPLGAEPFLKLKLSICFRITKEMADFINEKMNPRNFEHTRPPVWQQFRTYIEEWWGDGIRPNPDRPAAPGSVSYLTLGPGWSGLLPSFVAPMVAEELDARGIDNVAVISPSVGSGNDGNPVQRLINAPALKDYLWCVDRDSGPSKAQATRMNKASGDPSNALASSQALTQPQGPISDRDNKVLVSTIHKFKGLEREVIVVLGLDGFGERRCRNVHEEMDLFNLLYVACTRATHQLIAVQCSDCAYATMRAEDDEDPLDPSSDDSANPGAVRVTTTLQHMPFTKFSELPGDASDNTAVGTCLLFGKNGCSNAAQNAAFCNMDQLRDDPSPAIQELLSDCAEKASLPIAELDADALMAVAEKDRNGLRVVGELLCAVVPWEMMSTPSPLAPCSAPTVSPPRRETSTGASSPTSGTVSSSSGTPSGVVRGGQRSEEPDALKLLLTDRCCAVRLAVDPVASAALALSSEGLAQRHRLTLTHKDDSTRVRNVVPYISPVAKLSDEGFSSEEFYAHLLALNGTIADHFRLEDGLFIVAPASNVIGSTTGDLPFVHSANRTLSAVSRTGVSKVRLTPRCRELNGCRPGTVERIEAIVGLALEYHLEMVITGKVTVDGLEKRLQLREEGVKRKNRKSIVPKDLWAYLQNEFPPLANRYNRNPIQCSASPPSSGTSQKTLASSASASTSTRRYHSEFVAWPWPELLRVALAHYVIESESYHLWRRQIKAEQFAEYSAREVVFLDHAAINCARLYGIVLREAGVVDNEEDTPDQSNPKSKSVNCSNTSSTSASSRKTTTGCAGEACVPQSTVRAHFQISFEYDVGGWFSKKGVTGLFDLVVCRTDVLPPPADDDDLDNADGTASSNSSNSGDGDGDASENEGVADLYEEEHSLTWADTRPSRRHTVIIVEMKSTSESQHVHHAQCAVYVALFCMCVLGYPRSWKGPPVMDSEGFIVPPPAECLRASAQEYLERADARGAFPRPSAQPLRTFSSCKSEPQTSPSSTARSSRNSVNSTASGTASERPDANEDNGDAGSGSERAKKTAVDFATASGKPLAASNANPAPPPPAGLTPDAARRKVEGVLNVGRNVRVKGICMYPLLGELRHVCLREAPLEILGRLCARFDRTVLSMERREVMQFPHVAWLPSGESTRLSNQPRPNADDQESLGTESCADDSDETSESFDEDSATHGADPDGDSRQRAGFLPLVREWNDDDEGTHGNPIDVESDEDEPPPPAE